MGRPKIAQVDLPPYIIDVLTTEVIPITVEWKDLIPVGSTVSQPSAVIYDDANGIAVANAFINSYGANGSQAQYVLQGTSLLKGHQYTVIFSVNVNLNVYKQRLIVTVPR